MNLVRRYEYRGWTVRILRFEDGYQAVLRSDERLLDGLQTMALQKSEDMASTHAKQYIDEWEGCDE